MARILGISCFYHDAAAALLVDGVPVAMAEEERFSRKKHDSGFPRLAVKFCLDRAGIGPGDLDWVVFYEKPFRKFHRLLMQTLGGWPRTPVVFREAMLSWLPEKIWMQEIIRKEVGVPLSKILFVEHHLSHAASAFLASPYDEAAIYTVDGVGEWTTTTLGRAGTRADGSVFIDLEEENTFPHSLGLLYSAFTAFLGFEVNEGEYKVMGMAPYGRPTYLDQVRKVARLDDDGYLHLDLSYFAFHRSATRSFSPKLCRLFGPPRDSKEDVAPGSHYADIAASIQAFTEEAMRKAARHVQRRTGLRRLCMAGGVALNSVANAKILKETPFEEVWIQPAAGDSGGALGAALYADRVLLGNPRRWTMEHASWGAEYPDAEIEAFVRRENIRAERLGEAGVRARVVDGLMAGKVVGWLHGRFEWGPRALGHRSILADPRRAEMKDVVNAKIKFREPFRPFAPSVLVDEVPRYFDLEDARRHYPARFMLYVVPVKSDKIPAITHVDGTGRLQAVLPETNRPYHDLIREWGEASGVPVVLNTSFNLKGEPIVNTPADAYSTFRRCEMDMLALGPYILTK